MPVVVTTAAGTASSIVALQPYSPAFDLLDRRHVTAIILRSNGSGFMGMERTISWGPDRGLLRLSHGRSQAGDLVALFGVGFGPTTPAVPAGKVFSGAAPITEPFTLYINNKVVTPLFVGLSSAGLYQVNLIVPPGLGQEDVPIQAWVTGSFSTQGNIFFSLEGGAFAGCLETRDWAAVMAVIAATAMAVTAAVAVATAAAMAATVVTVAVVAMVATAGDLRFPAAKVQSMAYRRGAQWLPIPA